MILSKPQILEYIGDNRLRIDPPASDKDIEQVSIDLYLGNQFTTFKDPPQYLEHVILDSSVFGSLDLWQTTVTEEFILRPGEFVLAHTQQRITIPNDLVGLIEGRSSLARLGVTVHLTAPKIDPGFDGTITLEMAHFGKVPLKLRAGIDKPAQLMLMSLSTALDATQVYGSEASHRFQNQTAPLPQQPASSA